MRLITLLFLMASTSGTFGQGEIEGWVGPGGGALLRLQSESAGEDAFPGDVNEDLSAMGDHDVSINSTTPVLGELAFVQAPTSELVELPSIGYVNGADFGMNGELILIGIEDEGDGPIIVYTDTLSSRQQKFSMPETDKIIVSATSIGDVAYAIVKTRSNTMGAVWKIEPFHNVSVIYEFDSSEIPKAITTYTGHNGELLLAVLSDSYGEGREIYPRLTGLTLDGDLAFSQRYSVNFGGVPQKWLHSYSVKFWPSENAILLSGGILEGPAWLLKIDVQTLKVTFEKIFGEITYSEGRILDISLGVDGLLLAGDANKFGFASSQYGMDGLIVKLFYSGEIAWERLCGGTMRDTFKTVDQAIDGAVVLGGFSRSKTLSESGASWMASLTPNGSLQWEFETSPGGGEVVKVIANENGIYAIENPWHIRHILLETRPGPPEINWSGPHNYPFAPTTFGGPMGVAFSTTCYDPNADGSRFETTPLADLRISH